MRIGDTVIFNQGGAKPGVNGTVEHPAIVTRIWSDDENPTVNLYVMWDANPASPVTSVVHQSNKTDFYNPISDLAVAGHFYQHRTTEVKVTE